MVVENAGADNIGFHLRLESLLAGEGIYFWAILEAHMAFFKMADCQSQAQSVPGQKARPAPRLGIAEVLYGNTLSAAKKLLPKL